MSVDNIRRTDDDGFPMQRRSFNVNSTSCAAAPMHKVARRRGRPGRADPRPWLTPRSPTTDAVHSDGVDGGSRPGVQQTHVCCQRPTTTSTTRNVTTGHQHTRLALTASLHTAGEPGGRKKYSTSTTFNNNTNNTTFRTNSHSSFDFNFFAFNPWDLYTQLGYKK